MSNIPLMNGQRLETVSRTQDGVVLHRPIYQAVTSVFAADVLVAPLLANGSGSASLAVNGSVTPVKLWVAGAALKLTTIRALSLSLSDAGALAAGFGGLAALTTGLRIDLVATDGTTVMVDLTGGLGVRSHADLVSLGAVVDILDTSGGGDDVVGVRWTFPSPIELSAVQRFQITVRDDMTGLSAGRAVVSGDTRTA